MPERRATRPARGWLGGATPFGRLGRWLGFTWVFPIGTMAVPFHPLLARVLPWLPVAVVAYAGALAVAGRDGGVSPAWLLAAYVVVGLLLSVPVLQYAFFAFRLALLQGMLVSAAMVLIALDVAAGRSAQGWVVVPVAYAAFYLVLRLGGPLALRRTERKNAEVEPLDPGHRGVEVTGRRTEETAQWLVEHCDLPRVSAGGRSRLRVDAATYARVGEVAEQIDTGYTRVNGDVLVVHDLQPAAVRVHALRRRGWWRLLGDDLAEWDITDGDRSRRLVSGKAHLVGGLPVLVCFRFCAVFGGTSRWMIGFPRNPVGGSSTDERQVLTRVFPPLTASPHVVDPVEVLVPLENALVERRRRYLSLLEELAAEPDLSFRDARRAPDLALLTRVAGEVMAGSGERLCDLVDRAKEEHGLQVAIACARALARLPLGEFRSLTQRLLPIVGSRILSLQWTLTPELDVRPLPRGLPRFGDQGGFGLLSRVPDLFARLGELDDPRVLRVVEGLAAEAGWKHPLTEARDAYLSRHPR